MKIFYGRGKLYIGDPWTSMMMARPRMGRKFPGNKRRVHHKWKPIGNVSNLEINIQGTTTGLHQALAEWDKARDK